MYGLFNHSFDHITFDYCFSFSFRFFVCLLHSYGRLKLGDIIIKINDKRIRNGSDLFRALDKLSAGEKVNLTLLREDNEVVKSLELGSK